MKVTFFSLKCLDSTLASASVLAFSVSIASAGTGQFGGFGSLTTIFANSGGNGPSDITQADLDGDGRLDLISVGGGSIELFFGDGGGGFTHNVISINGAGEGVVIGDFNGDGNADIAASRRGLSDVAVLINDGSGAFSQAFFGVGAGPSDIAQLDIDGDGDVDLIVVNENASALTVLWNDGTGQFNTSESIPSGGSSPRGIDSADLDGDGHPDFVTTTVDNNSIHVHLNDGNGGFDLVSSHAAPTSPWEVILKDFDSDGDMDIASVSRSGGQAARIWLNDGNGAFAQNQTVPLGDWSEDVVAADLDGDGDIDLAAALINTGQAAVILLNNGTGSFTALSPTSMGGSVNCVALADIDGNGSPDLIAGLRSSGRVSYRSNLTDVIPPGAFALLTPQNKMAGLALPESLASWDLDAAFRWTRANGFTVDYEIAIATDFGMTNVVAGAGDLAERTFAMPLGVLEAATTYYWSVTATNQAGVTIASPEVASFTTGAPADFNGDGVVNGADLASLLASWGIVE